MDYGRVPKMGRQIRRERGRIWLIRVKRWYVSGRVACWDVLTAVARTLRLTLTKGYLRNLGWMKISILLMPHISSPFLSVKHIHGNEPTLLSEVVEKCDRSHPLDN